MLGIHLILLIKLLKNTRSEAQDFINDYPYLFEVENLNDFIAKADTLLGSLASSKELVERNRTIIQQQYTVKTNLEAFQILLKD